MRRLPMLFLLLHLSATIASAAAASGAADAERYRGLAREIFEDLIARRTAAGHGQVPAMAEALAQRFRDGGFPAADVHVLPLELPEETTASLVVRYRGDGSGGRPILMLAHMDVVDALRDDWSIEPYRLTEKDGYFYGRGTTDNKTGITALTTTFLRLKAEGFLPTRDLVLAFSGDEETSMLTTEALVNEHRAFTDAEFALNADAGGGSLNDQGEPVAFEIQSAEKTYATFELEVRNRGGHSSTPRPDNAIYQLARALQRLERHRFPVRSNDTTVEYFRRNAGLVGGELGAAMRDFAEAPRDGDAADRLGEVPALVGITRTTCVATMLAAGHAENALPQTATATVNCRIFPGVAVAEVSEALERVVADDEISIRMLGNPYASPASPLRQDLWNALGEVVESHYPGTPLVPYMAPYATDGKAVRAAGIPTYGVSGMFLPSDDIRAHGRDERIPVAAFYGALDHWYGLLRALAGR